MLKKGKKDISGLDSPPRMNRIHAFPSGKQDRMLKILGDLKKKIDELEDIRKGISRPVRSISPSQARAMIEEIKVPSLELIDAKPKKHSQVSSA